MENKKSNVHLSTVHRSEDISIDISFDMNIAFNSNILENATTDIL